MLRSVGAPVDRLENVPGALRARLDQLSRRWLEPVTVAWEGRLPPISVRLPSRVAGRTIRWCIDLESGERIESGDPVRLEPSLSFDVEGRTVVEGLLRIAQDERLPQGYHRLVIDGQGGPATSLVIAAPRRATQPPDRPQWGLFLPLYALSTRRTQGIADLTDLQALTEWVASQGGGMVATLPLLAAFFEDQLYEPSPYSPASRLFWNELYVDPTALPEFDRSTEARSLLDSPEYRRRLQALGRTALVDHRAVMGARRSVLEALARTFFDQPGPRQGAFDAAVRKNPRLLEYAAFRAACERHRAPWSRWPARERRGKLPPEGGDRAAYRYHAYVQWAADEQLSAVGRRAGEAGAGLYFDMPLGVNPAGYDVWREGEAFLSGVSAGAPPDLFFKAGQDWGLLPLSPEGMREQSYRYPIAVIRHLFRHAGVVRLDHVMGLHRLFVVPVGMRPKDGVYVRYRPEELYAILCLESRRSGTVLVGEDLGTVPAAVPRALRRHGIERSYVMQFALTGTREGVRPAPRDAMASFGTHDLATFAGFWRDLDIDRLLELGWVDRAEAGERKADRGRRRSALVAALVAGGLLAPEDEGSERAILRACLRYLGQSEATMVVLSLEDLWLETEPQNLPGTTTQYPNWRRRARHPFEAFRRMPEVLDLLREVDARRGAGVTGPPPGISTMRGRGRGSRPPAR